MQCCELSIMADISGKENSNFCNTIKQFMLVSHQSEKNIPHPKIKLHLRNKISCSHIEFSSMNMRILIANINKVFTEYRSSHWRRCSTKKQSMSWSLKNGYLAPAGEQNIIQIFSNLRVSTFRKSMMSCPNWQLLA